MCFSRFSPRSGIFQKNNSCVLEEMIRQQQELLGVDTLNYKVGTLSHGSHPLQHHGKAPSEGPLASRPPQSQSPFKEANGSKECHQRLWFSAR